MSSLHLRLSALGRVASRIGRGLTSWTGLKSALKEPKKVVRVAWSPIVDVKFRSVPPIDELERLRKSIILTRELFPPGITTLEWPEAVRELRLSEYVDLESALKLGSLFKQFGSDKCDLGYEVLYQPLLAAITPRIGHEITLAEIGLGTNNPDVLSNMGPLGHPGASLRAFRAYLERGNLLGGDIDQRVLFQEQRIRTTYVDQLNEESLDRFFASANRPSLTVDDGLHTLQANLYTFQSWMRHAGPGDWIVIEDIEPSSVNESLWQIIACELRRRGTVALIRFPRSLVLVFQLSATTRH